jgi:hypothetical protein
MRRSSLIIFIISLVFVLFVFYSLFHLEPIQVIGDRLDHVGQAVVVRGTAINRGSGAQSAGLKVELFDAAGRKLAVQELSLGKLTPGQRVEFTSRPVNAAAAEKFTIQVDHGTNMYGN